MSIHGHFFLFPASLRPVFLSVSFPLSGRNSRCITHTLIAQLHQRTRFIAVINLSNTGSYGSRSISGQLSFEPYQAPAIPETNESATTYVVFGQFHSFLGLALSYLRLNLNFFSFIFVIAKVKRELLIMKHGLVS